jgi:predicted transcriptional regulator
MADPDQQALLVRLTANIASAYVAANSLGADDLPGLIRTIHGGLAGEAREEPGEPQPPAVAIRKSITPDYLICLEDGLKFRSLKRHLRSNHGLSPDVYRTKWGLPKTYPMVAPALRRNPFEISESDGPRPRRAPGKADQNDSRGEGLGASRSRDATLRPSRRMPDVGVPRVPYGS